MHVKRQAAPIREQAASNIRAAIIQGEYKPGQRLLEKDLCQRTGVSRTSIREALRQLEAEGIVKLIPNKGPCVSTLTVSDAREIFEVRKILESYAFQLFAERADASQMAELVDMLEVFRSACDGRGEKDLVLLKDQFYHALLKGCRNDLILNILKSINARIAFLRRLSLSNRNRPKNSLIEIKKIVAYLKTRNAQGAWKASMEHVSQAEKAAVAALRELQEKEISADEIIMD